MTISNQIKNNIAIDWIAQFPQLSIYSPNRLFKKIGPFICGIEIKKLPRTEAYRPYFVCYPLWKVDEKECLNEPYILQEIVGRNRVQLEIPFSAHQTYFKDAAEYAQKQIVISLDKDVHMHSIDTMIENQFSDILVRSSPVQQAKLFEFRLFCALYINNHNLINKALIVTHRAGKEWNPDLYEWKFGKFDQWFSNLKNSLNLRDQFLSRVLSNSDSQKLNSLHSSQLIF